MTFQLPDGDTRFDAAAPLIRFERVGKTFPARKTSAEVTALAEIDLEVKRGGILAIIGKSGAGKSTLIRLVNALERPTSGRILFEGQDIAALSAGALRETRRSIGMIFQHFNLLSSRTVFDNVALPLEIAGIGKAEIARRVGPLLDLVGLDDKRARYPVELSGGQKQRVGIARALATRPKALLSDEATSALDPETTRSILDLLGQVNRDLGVTILLITHEMSVVRGVAQDVAVMQAGRIVETGNIFDIFTRPKHEATRALLSAEAGQSLPAWVAERLLPEAVPGGQMVARITFRGPYAADPVLSQLARVLKVDVNILSGHVDTIAGQLFGTIVVGIDGDREAVAGAFDFLTRRGLDAQVLGHLAATRGALRPEVAHVA